MQEIICDICKTEPACLRIKTKISKKYFFGTIPIWSSWKAIDICENCNIILNELNEKSVFSPEKKVIERPEPKNIICKTK